MSLVEASIRLLANVTEAAHARDSHDAHDSHDHHDSHDYEFHDSHDLMATSNNKPWLEVILASLLVNIASLSGLIIVVFAIAIPRAKKWKQQRMQPSADSDDDDNDNGIKPYITPLVDNILLPCFAAGALLATCVFLLIPESLHMLEDGSGHDDHDDHGDGHDSHGHFRSLGEDDHDDHGGHDDHEGHDDHGSGAAWKFGASLLGGFLLPILLHVIFPAPHLPDERTVRPPSDNDEQVEMDKAAPSNETDDIEPKKIEEGETAKVDTTVDKIGSSKIDKSESAKRLVAIDWGLAMSILLGDFFHNFTDGVFIGNAFLLCDKSLAYTLAASTLYHEFAQEIADFYLLTNYCGFKIWEALVLNFVSGVSVMIGALIIVSIDIPLPATGSILAIGAGCYVYVACSECIPRALSFNKRENSRKHLMYGLLSFAVGAIPIGLVLINHSHGC